MWSRPSLSSLVTFLSIFSLLSIADAKIGERLIESRSLNPCQKNSSFTASLFNVIFYPNASTVDFEVVGVSSVSGNVTFKMELSAYGYQIMSKEIDPCTLPDLKGLCPMQTGQMDLDSNFPIDKKTIEQVPGIAYGIPDLDARVRVYIKAKGSASNESLACVEAQLSNGQTVEQKGVSWTTAIIAGMGLVASAVASGLGHSNTAAHVAANAMSLFGYFQSLAMVGLVAVPLPPIVNAWTQNFQWTMGLINVRFIQDIATWYQKSTGGTPATLMNSLTTMSVQVLKRSVVEPGRRSMEQTIRLLTEAHNAMHKRSNNEQQSTLAESYTVTGIERAAFKAGIESTNVFFMGLAFFCIFIVFTIAAVGIFKGFCELAVRQRWMKPEKFQDFRNGWFTVLKGIMFRLVLIGFPQMVILCLWEFTRIDSAAEVVLAIFFFFGMVGTLGWASWKVVRLAKRSQEMHKNPAYILYSDPSALNKWGFLYVQFRASAYYYIIPTLAYVLFKGMFIAFAQKAGTVQVIALLLIEAVALIAASVLRPWMDKSTNTFNISIAAINFVNAIFLLFFSNVFNQPAIVTGVMGVVFFILNAAFSLILLILVLVATTYAFIRKNPDTRYQPMQDDRASFIKSATALNTELDALGATARGDQKNGYKQHNLDLDDDSWSSDSMRQATNQPLPPSTANSAAHYNNPPRSPVDPSMPLFPAGHNDGRGPPPNYGNNQPQMYQSYNSSQSQISTRSQQPSSSPYRDNNNSTSNVSGFRTQQTASPTPNPGAYRSQNNAR